MNDTTPTTPDEAALAWYDDQQLDDVPPAATWDDVLADRMLASLLAARRRRDSEQDVWRQRITELQEQADRLAARHQDRIVQLEHVLSVWMLERRSRTSTKSVSLPSGHVRTRAGRDRVTIDDSTDPADLPSDFVAVVPATLTVRKSEISAALKSGRLVTTSDGHLVDTDTGETLPGVGVVIGSVSVSFAADD